MTKDHYKTLGLGESASPEEIKKTFRRLAKKYHPDRNKNDKNAEQKFKEISGAYEILSDEKKRAEYDNLRKYGAFAGGQGPSGATGFGTGGFSTADFQQFFSRGGGSGARGFGYDGSVSASGLEDILASFFGKGAAFGGRSNTAQPTPGADLSAEVSITFMESVNGGTRLLTLPGGKKLRVKIPNGIEDGGRIRLAGQGRPGYLGGINGDLIITVRVMPDQKFNRKGNDIYTSVTISFVEAIRGCKVSAHTLTKKVALTVPPGTQSGVLLRLKGQGLAVGGKQGDQYVEIKVEIPKKITARQSKLLDEWEE